MSNLDSFHERLRRIEKARRKDEAKSPAARKSPRARRARRVRRSRMLMPLLSIAFVLTLFYAPKVLLMQHMGPRAYQAQVERLMQGEAVDLVVGIIMTPDTITRAIYEKSKPYFDRYTA